MRSMKSSSSSEKREFIKERDNSLHQARKEKKNPSRRDKILRKHQAMRKKRDSFQKKKKKKKKKERERERSECKNFH